MSIKGRRHKFTPKIQRISWSCMKLLLLIAAITHGKTVSAQHHQQSGFECNDEGYHQDPTSCSIYYRCVNWGNGSPLTKFKFECGPGTVFSHAQGDICVHPRDSERSECSESENDLGGERYEPSSNGQAGPPAHYPSYGSPLPGTPSSGLSSPTSGSFESTSTRKPWPGSNNYPGSENSHNNGGTQCQQEGFKPDEHDCRKFIRCVSNGGNSYQRYEFTCGEGTVWDPSIEACNHVWAVSRNNCAGPSNGGSNVGGGNQGSNEPNGYPGSAGEPGNTGNVEQSESNEVPKPPGGYPQAPDSSSAPSRPNAEYPQYPNQGYPQSPPDTGSSGPSYPSQSLNPPQPPASLYPPPSSGYPPSQPDDNPNEGPSQQPGNSPGSFQPPSYPGMPITQPDYPNTSESSGTWEPDDGSNAVGPPGGLYPPPQNPSGEQPEGSGQGRPKPDASGFCKEEGFFADPNDCKKFYRCVEGEGSYQKYEFTCAEGTAWDQGLLTCNHEYAVPGCTSSTGSERPGGIDTETTSSSSSNEVTSEPDSNQQPTSESEGTTPVDGSTTESSGTTVTTSQPSSSDNPTSGGTTTDENKEAEATSEMSTTVTDTTSESTPESTPESTSESASESTSESTTESASESTSETTSESTSETTTEGLPESTSESEIPSESTSPSADGSSTPSTEAKPDQGSSNVSPSKPTSGSCQAEGFFADPNDCHKFYRCVSFDHSSASYTKFKFDCGPGTAWDQNLQTCNYEHQVESCGASGENKPTSEAPGDSKPSSEAPDGSTPSSEAPDESMNEIEPSSKPTESSESTPSSTEESSDMSSTSVVSTESSEATTSPSSETEETPTQATTTEKSSSAAETTPSDITESTPDSSSEATTPSATEQSSTEEPTDTSPQPNTEATTPSDSSSESTSPTPSESPSTPFKCTAEGFFPNPSDCHKFIRCVKVNNGYIKYQFDCGPGTAWDQNLLTCNYEEQVESCSGGGDPSTASSSTMPSSSSTDSSEATETTQPSTDSQTTPDESTTDIGESTTPTDESTTPTDESTTPTDESTTPADETTTPEATEGTPDAESTTPGSEEGETTEPTSAETTTTDAEEMTTTAGTEGSGTEAPAATEAPTTDTSVTVPPGSTVAPCGLGNLTDEQIVLVCPTGFRRHSKHCNMFYQCTHSGNMEIKVLVFACPEGTIFDEKKVQCLNEEETDEKCMSPEKSSRFYRQLEDNPNSPVRVTRSALCPDEGHYPYQEGCSNAFYKCMRDSRNSLQGYLYKCPKDFVYWSVSRRCERASRLPMCSNVTYDNNERRRAWESRSNLPIEEFNISARSLKF